MDTQQGSADISTGAADRQQAEPTILDRAGDALHDNPIYQHTPESIKQGLQWSFGKLFGDDESQLQPASPSVPDTSAQQSPAFPPASPATVDPVFPARAARPAPDPNQVKHAAYIGAYATQDAPHKFDGAQLARYFGVSQSVISAMPDAFSQRRHYLELQKSLANAPLVCEAIREQPHAAGQITPDVPLLARMEHLLGSAYHKGGDYFGKLYQANAPKDESAGAAVKTIAGMNLDLLKDAMHGANRMTGEFGNGLLLGFNRLAHFMSLVSSVPLVGVDKLNELLNGDYSDPLETLWFDHTTRYLDETAPRFDHDPETGFPGKVLHTAGQVASQVPGILATGGSGASANVSRTLLARAISRSAQSSKAMAIPATTAAVETGNQVYAHTKDPVAALGAATTQYLTITATGALPMSLPGRLPVRVATAAPLGAATGEAVRQVNNAALPADMRQPFSLEDTFLNGFVGPMFSLMGERSPHVEARQAEHNQQLLQQVSELSQRSSLRKTDPQAWSRLIRKMGQQGLHTLHLDAHVLAKAMENNGLAQETFATQMPRLARQLPAALRDHGQVELSIEDYATYIAGNRLDADIRDHLKTSPDGMSLAEAREFKKEQQAQLEHREEQPLEEKPEEPGRVETRAEEQATIAPDRHPLFDEEQWAKYQKELQAMSPENRAMAERFADKLRDYDAAVAEYAKLNDSHGGKVLNTDLARELSPDYLKDRTRSEVVQRLSSALVRKMYADRLAATKEPMVILSAGGPGAGKTTVLNELPALGRASESADIVYDTTMSHYGSAKGMIEQALQANGLVDVVLVIREPVDALLNGVIRRAVEEEKLHGSGRTVTLDYFLSAQPAAIRNVFRLAEEYKGNSDVQFRYVDNNHGLNRAKEVTLEQAKQIEFQQVEERAREILEQEYRDGRISKKIYTGIKFGKAVP